MQPLNHQYKTMPWDIINCVVFDVGNVLLYFDPDEIMRRVLPGKEMLYPILMEKVFRSPYWLMRDRGSISKEQAVKWMVGDEVSLLDPIGRMMDEWVHLKRPVAEGIRALEVCKQHGKKILVLSNYAREPFQVVREEYDFFRWVDGFLVSGEEGVIKPDPEIYKLLLERFHLVPERTLFIDDSVANVESALHMGIHSIHYSAPGILERFFCER